MCWHEKRLFAVLLKSVKIAQARKGSTNCKKKKCQPVPICQPKPNTYLAQSANIAAEPGWVFAFRFLRLLGLLFVLRRSTRVWACCCTCGSYQRQDKTFSSAELVKAIGHAHPKNDRFSQSIRPPLPTILTTRHSFSIHYHNKNTAPSMTAFDLS